MSEVVQRGPLMAEQAPDLFVHHQHSGDRRAPVIICESPGLAEAEHIPFSTPYLLIGRSSRCDVSLAHADVSYRHAYLQRIDDRILCVDLDSRTGIGWGAKTKRAGWLERHQRIAIGPYTFRAATGTEDTAGSDDGLDVPSDQEFRLHFPNGVSESIPLVDYHFFRPVTLVGRSKFCNIWLQDDSVSRVHCSFVLTRRGLWIVDLLGRGGTRVNRTRIRSVLLQDGDRVKIGRFRFRVHGTAAGRKAAKVHLEEAERRVAGTIGPPSSLVRDDEAHDAASLALTSHGGLIPRSGTPASGFSENFVMSVINEFAAMQQEMFAQTRQQMVMMAQLFDRMHESHRSLIHEDLHRVQEITQELYKLRTELLQTRAAQSASPESDSGKHAKSPKSNGSANGRRSTGRTPPGLAGRMHESHGLEAGEAAATPVNGDPPSDHNGSTARNHRDVASHAWLAERMCLLEQERAGRWQKIMQALTRGGQGTS